MRRPLVLQAARRAPRRRLALLPALGLAVGLGLGCHSTRRPLVIDSEPPGAAVWLDGEETGFATPCALDLGGSSIRTVELRLNGYQTAVRDLEAGEWSQAILWREMTTEETWRFPLFLATEDALFPVKQSDGEMPSRLHVRLQRIGR